MIYLFVLPPPNPHCEGPFLPLVLVPYSLCKCVICVSGLYLMGGLCFYFWGLTKMPMRAFQTYVNLDFLQMPTFLQLFSFKTLRPELWNFRKVLDLNDQTPNSLIMINTNMIVITQLILTTRNF